MTHPEHNTINRFRSSKLKMYIEEIFTQIVELFIQEGFISIEEAYIDGTKIELMPISSPLYEIIYC